jgi:hypothetical protein
VDVGLEANAEMEIDFKIWDYDRGKTWERPYDLAVFYGTGDVGVTTSTTGIDIDPNGYSVSLFRTMPNSEPVWNDILNDVIQSTGNIEFEGELCRDLNVFCDPCGIQDCGLAATEHDVELADVMWNCAVDGESSRTICIEYGEQAVVSYDVQCISVYDALADIIGMYFDEGLIDGLGIRRSLVAKLEAAEKKRDRGQCWASGNILTAFQNEVEAQCGQHIDTIICEDLLTKADQIRSYCTPSNPSKFTGGGE